MESYVLRFKNCVYFTDDPRSQEKCRQSAFKIDEEFDLYNTIGLNKPFDNITVS